MDASELVATLDPLTFILSVLLASLTSDSTLWSSSHRRRRPCIVEVEMGYELISEQKALRHRMRHRFFVSAKRARDRNLPARMLFFATAQTS